MLEIKSLTVKYNDNVVVDNISLNCNKGEIVVITGLSGSGKTTVLKAINGIIPEFSIGEITGEINLYKDKKIDLLNMKIEDKSKYISTVFQNPKNQFFCVNAYEEITFPLENRAVPPKEIVDTVDKYTRLFKMESYVNNDIYRLSGGQRQIVAICSTAVMENEIYLFDEPSSSLDDAAIEKLKDIIVKLKKMGKIIIIVEHRLFYLRDILTKLCLVNDGKLLDLTKIVNENIISDRYNIRKLFKVSKESLYPIEVNILSGKEYEVGNGENSLEVKNVKCKFKNKVLDFSINIKSPLTVIIGENGIGKTTFIRTLCGLNKKGKCKASFNGKSLKPQGKNISLVMQDVNYQIFTDSLEREVSLATNNKEDIEKALRLFDLYDKKDLHPQALSGGEKQRLMIALAYVSPKQIVIFDEPTSGLCRQNMKNLVEAISEMKKVGKTIIVITHDYEFISYLKCEVIEFIK